MDVNIALCRRQFDKEYAFGILLFNGTKIALVWMLRYSIMCADHLINSICSRELTLDFLPLVAIY